jgi:hypothetical protein
MWMWIPEKYIRRRSETFFTAITRKINIFGDVMSCNMIENDQRFGEISYTPTWSNWLPDTRPNILEERRCRYNTSFEDFLTVIKHTPTVYDHDFILLYDFRFSKTIKWAQEM